MLWFWGLVADGESSSSSSSSLSLLSWKQKSRPEEEEEEAKRCSTEIWWSLRVASEQITGERRPTRKTKNPKRKNLMSFLVMVLDRSSRSDSGSTPKRKGNTPVISFLPLFFFPFHWRCHWSTVIHSPIWYWLSLRGYIIFKKYIPI